MAHTMKAPLVYTLKGDPTPLARPRWGGRYNQPHVYDSQANIKLITGIQIKEQHGNLPPYHGPLELHASFYFPAHLPFRKKKVKEGDWHVQTPDLDNLVKYLCDICQSANLFKNDSQITRIIGEKKFEKESRTEFYFIELNKESHESINLFTSSRDKSNNTLSEQ